MSQILSSEVQFNSNGRLRHLLTLEGLERAHLVELLDAAMRWLPADNATGGPFNPVSKSRDLEGISVINLFFENSTRTRTTFEIAATRLSADLLNLDVERSSTSKGESLADTVANLCAMGARILILRHAESGMPYRVASQLPAGVHLINAGDGSNAHPTQGLLDMLTIAQLKGDKCPPGKPYDFSHLSFAIVGDVMHSRVARSDLSALLTLGCRDIRLVGPTAFVPPELAIDSRVRCTQSLAEGLDKVDVVMGLRIQKERMQASSIPDVNEYFRLWGITTESLQAANKDAIVMHPGPVNRGIEISSEVVDGPQSAILTQVRLGIAVRMAVMVQLMKGD